MNTFKLLWRRGRDEDEWRGFLAGQEDRTLAVIERRNIAAVRMPVLTRYVLTSAFLTDAEDGQVHPSLEDAKGYAGEEVGEACKAVLEQGPSPEGSADGSGSEVPGNVYVSEDDWKSLNAEGRQFLTEAASISMMHCVEDGRVLAWGFVVAEFSMRVVVEPHSEDGNIVYLPNVKVSDPAK